MLTVKAADFRGTPVPAKRRKKKASAAASAVCSAQAAPPAAGAVRPDGSAKKTVKKKKKRSAAGGGSIDGAACAEFSSRFTEPVTVAPVAAKEVDDIFASLTDKKAVRDAKRRDREEQEAQDEADQVAAAKKAARLLRSLPRDSVFGEAYDPDAAFDPMKAPIHRVCQHGQKWEICNIEGAPRRAA